MTESAKVIINQTTAQAKLETLYSKGIFVVPGTVDDGMAFTFMMDLFYSELSGSVNKDAPLWVVVNSPGGLIPHGLGVYDIIRALIAKGRTVNTIGYGEVASMAVCIMQAGSQRYSLPNTQYLIHQASYSGGGDERREVNEMAEDAKELERMNNIVLGIISERSGMDMKKLKKISKKTDYSLNPRDAKNFGPKGLIDEIVTTPPFLL